MAITSRDTRNLLRTEMSEFEHLVQFCESDVSLVNAVSEFIGAGLKTGDACIVIATKPHRESLEQQLREDGLEVAAAREHGQYISIDAAAMLSKFMIDGSPSIECFVEIFGDMIAQAAQDHRRVRVFGEMVALLWAAGHRSAAIRLEELWNVLGKTHSFSLFCAYPMQSFGGEKFEAEFSAICHRHSYVIPGESYSLSSNPDERLRAITLLQQKALSLEFEIAERKKAEERLQVLAAIVESSDDAILSKELDGIITSWNRAAERIYGYTAEEMVGQSVTLIFPPGRQDEFSEIMERIHRGERVDHYETQRVRKDGVILTVSVTVSPVKNSAGAIIGASAIARDITEQKRLESKFRHLFDSSLIGVFVSDFAGTFLDANDAFLNLVGYTREELQAGAIHRDDITPAEFHYLSQNAVKALQETGSADAYEKEYVHKSGKRIPVLLAVTRIEHTDTCIGFVMDISERKELDQRKDVFISLASHELKTPVTSLKGFLNLLHRRLSVQGNEKDLHYLDRMDTQVNKLTRLIGDLLDISRIQTGQLIYRKERFDMDELAQEVVENIQGTTQTHHLVLEDHAQVEVFGDRDRIGQVLINLLNNAIKYSSQADTVLIQVSQDQNMAIVSVQDFGIGIAKVNHHKIFERFYQVAEPVEETYPGLGIGLYISCEIVKRHGGHLWVESEQGEGATFHLSLPLYREGEEQASVE